jgi:hypothetical protein
LVGGLDVADGVEQQDGVVLVDSGVFVIPVVEFVFLVLDPFEIHHDIVMSIFDIDPNVSTFKRSYSFDVFNIPTSLFDLAQHRFIGLRYFLCNLVDLDCLDFPGVNEDQAKD